MKVHSSSNFDFPDTTVILTKHIYVRLTFYPASCWTWEWVVQWAAKPAKAVRVELPTCTFHFALIKPNTHA